MSSITDKMNYLQDTKKQIKDAIIEKGVAVEEGDTPEILQRRVMEQAEWIILPQAIQMIASQKDQIR